MMFMRFLCLQSCEKKTFGDVMRESRPSQPNETCFDYALLTVATHLDHNALRPHCSDDLLRVSRAGLRSVARAQNVNLHGFGVSVRPAVAVVAWPFRHLQRPCVINDNKSLQ